ncbi:BBE domain-containing protein [Nocardiopsis quinghaiensis]|uniref:BBE domain-containing protein n=1 Tax=Nocardiopsis quinghaiensis TaxID=464995 RepID=UPI001CC232DB|nr:BBE domain-containing protein [Nocardiopsis quinghaiensis]
MTTTDRAGRTDGAASRRGFLGGGLGALAAGVATGGGLSAVMPAPAEAAAVPAAKPAPGATIGPGDPRYPLLTTGNNQRYVAQPDYIRMITSAKDAENALEEAVGAGKRISLRSGGHCFADLVCNPDVEVILDCSPLTEVGYDKRMRAFYVDAGARLLPVYEALYNRWGVTVPGGICYSVGAGGHISGGGYGLLSRAHGLVVDHLYAVRVTFVDERGSARTVVATRERKDPNRDLWWAHTGGGGGNFGLVTRYWFRSPDAKGTEPSDQLVSPPSRVLVSSVDLPWDQVDRNTFKRVLKNFGSWHGKHSGPDSDERHLSSLFNVNSKVHGSLSMFTQVDATIPNARDMLDRYTEAILAGTGLTPASSTAPSGELPALPGLVEPREMPWLQATKLVGTNNPTITDPTMRAAHKSGYMRKNFTDTQLNALYDYMTRSDYRNPNTMLVLFSFGARVNAVDSHATANAQRSSIFKMTFQNFWADAADDDFYLSWIRGLYADFFAETKGVPEPGERMDGCYINYADNDIADDDYNTSGIPWHYLYYKDNYARLQEVKRKYDPANVFRHALSIEPAE